MTRYIAVYAGSNNDFNFFFRMKNGLKKNNYKLLFLVNKLSIVLKAMTNNQKYYLIKTTGKISYIPDLSGCYDIRSGNTSYEDAEILYSSVFNAFRSLSEKITIDFIFIWNGLSIQTMAASNYARTAGIKTRFFELSNLPGKTFVNPEGVNADSGLFKDITVLENYNSLSEKEFLQWKREYLLWKLSDNKLPQEKYIRKINNYLFFFDLIGFKLLGLPVNGETRIRKKIKEFVSRQNKIPYDEYILGERKYVFLPLQVSNDTQLTFHSSIDNYEAINFGYKRASELNADLVVKPHPAECSNDFINKLIELKQELKFHIVNYNVWELVKNSSLVVTINSTVGLEALIFGKKIEFLGKSFYPYLQGSLLKNYIMNYLVEGEYFSEKEFSNNSVKRILAIK